MAPDTANLSLCRLLASATWSRSSCVPARCASLLTWCANLRPHRWPACVGPVGTFFIDRVPPIHLFCIKFCSGAARKQSIMCHRASDRNHTRHRQQHRRFNYLFSSPVPRRQHFWVRTSSRYLSRIARKCRASARCQGFQLWPRSNSSAHCRPCWPGKFRRIQHLRPLQGPRPPCRPSRVRGSAIFFEPCPMRFWIIANGLLANFTITPASTCSHVWHHIFI